MAVPSCLVVVTKGHISVLFATSSQQRPLLFVVRENRGGECGEGHLLSLGTHSVCTR